MGFHHQNDALLDDRLEVERPEMLVYERLPNGQYRLNGVEYIVPFSARPETSPPPTVMGQALKRRQTVSRLARQRRAGSSAAAGGFLPVGRTLFAVAITGLGVLCLVFVDFVHQLQPIGDLLSPSTPGYRVLAVLTGAALIAAGLAIAGGLRVTPFSAALAGFFASWIVCLQVPSAFLNPVLLRSPWWVRTFEILALAGGALALAGVASPATRESWIRAGRVLFGVSLPVFGILHFIYAENTGSLDDPAALLRARAGLTSMFKAIGMCGVAWIVAGSLTNASRPAEEGDTPTS